MTSRLDFAAALAAVGGSLIADELRGDLGAARAAVDADLARARAEPQASGVGAAALAVGLVATLQGDAGLAIERLDEALDLGVSNPSAQVAYALREVAGRLRWNVFPGAAGAGGLDLTRRRIADPVRIAPPAPVGSGTAELLEAAMLRAVLVGLPDRRAIVAQATQAGLDPGAFLETLLEDLPPPGLPVPARWLAYVDLAAAGLCWPAGRADLARERLARALAGYEAAGDPVGAGCCHLADGDWRAAPFTSPLVWNRALVEGGYFSELAWSLEGRELRRDGADPDGARTAYARAAACFDQGGAPRGAAAVVLRQAYLAMLADDLKAAARHAGRARVLFEAAGDRLGAHLAAAHGALIAVAAGRLPEDRAVAQAIGAWGSTEGSFAFALGIGLLFTRLGRQWDVRDGDPERALACHRLAWTVFEALDAAPNCAQSLVDRGRVYRAIGDWASAALLYDQALERGERALAGDFQGDLVLALRQQGILLEQRVLHIVEKDGERLAQMTPRLREQEQRLAALIALPGSQPELEIFRACIADSIAEDVVLAPLYEAMQARDRDEQWVVDRERDAALGAAQGDARRADYFVALVQGSIGDRAAGLVAFLRFLQSPAATAASACDQRLRSPEDLLEEQAAFLVQLRAWAQAQERFDQLEASAGPTWWQRADQPWVSLDYRGQAREGLGDLSAALADYDLAIAALEGRRERLNSDELRSSQAGAGAAGRPFFHAARAALASAARAEDAGDANAARALRRRTFSYAERGKARALLDLMAANTTFLRASPEQSERTRRWRQLNAQVALARRLLVRARAEGDIPAVTDLQARLGADQNALAALEAQLSAQHPRWLDAVSPTATVLEVDEVAARLAPGTLMLQYMFRDEDLLAWAVTADGLVAVHREHRDARALISAIGKLWTMCRSGSDKWQALARELGEIFLAPFAAQLKECQHVVFVPFDAAHRLPLHALPFGGEPLIATRTTSVLPSASAIAFLGAPATAPTGPALAVGDPAAMSNTPLGQAEPERLGALPWAGAEAVAVGSLLPGSEVLVGGEATEAAVREHIGRFPIVHLATHAELADAPLDTYLALAGGDVITLYELMGLGIDGAQLVVLSACESGGGQVTFGDEVVGLTRGLLAAGARAAVVSLWKVHDHSTPLLMREFYRRMTSGASPAAALREAQQHVRSLDEASAAAEREELRALAAGAGHPVPATAVKPLDYAHPRHWAPFVLVGA